MPFYIRKNQRIDGRVVFVFFPKRAVGGWWCRVGGKVHFLQRFFDVLNIGNVNRVSKSILEKIMLIFHCRKYREQKMWVSSNSSLKIFLLSISVNHPFENMSKRTTFAHKLPPIQSHHFVDVDLELHLGSSWILYICLWMHLHLNTYIQDINMDVHKHTYKAWITLHYPVKC